MIIGTFEGIDFKIKDGVVVCEDKITETFLEGLKGDIYNPNSGLLYFASIADGDMEAFLLLTMVQEYFEVKFIKAPEISSIPEGEGVVA